MFMEKEHPGKFIFTKKQIRFQQTTVHDIN